MHNTGFFPNCCLLSVTNGSIWIPYLARYSEIFKKPNFQVVKWKSMFIWKMLSQAKLENEVTFGYDLWFASHPSPALYHEDTLEKTLLWRHSYEDTLMVVDVKPRGKKTYEMFRWELKFTHYFLIRDKISLIGSRSQALKPVAHAADLVHGRFIAHTCILRETSTQTQGHIMCVCIIHISFFLSFFLEWRMPNVITGTTWSWQWAPD